jgi:hypothetical protein
MKIPIVLATNAPLFFRHRDGEYRVRVMAVNDKASRRDHSRAKRRPSLKEFEECFHYVSIGDLRLCIALMTYFLGELGSVETKIVYSSRELDDPFNPSDELNLFTTKNLVALGNPRVSWVVSKLQEHIQPTFFIQDRDQRRIRNREPKPEEPTYYEDKVAPFGSLHAAVIRHCSKGRVETVVCVQNGPALEAIAGVLTDDAKLKAVMDQTGWKNGFPECFELLFCVGIGKNEVIHRQDAPKLLAWRETPVT